MKRAIILCVIFGLLIPTIAFSQLSASERLAKLEGAVEQMSKRIDDFGKRIDDLRTDISTRMANLEESLNVIKNEINQRLSALSNSFPNKLEGVITFEEFSQKPLKTYERILRRRPNTERGILCS